MLGSMLSSLSQRMVRLGTTALMLSGAGLAGYSYYLDQNQSAAASGAMAWVKSHAVWFIVIGVAGIVVGFVVNMVTARRIAKRMMGSMGMPGMQGMGGMGGMSSLGLGGGMDAAPGLRGMPGGPSQMMGWPAPTEIVKVRCKSCSSLELEGAVFCSKCGKPMA
jgi:hypothetical protein